MRPLGLEGKGDVRGARDGLVRHLDFFGRPLQDRGDARFSVAALAEGDAGPDPLAGNGIGHKDGEVAVLRGNLGDAFSAKGDIKDVELEHLAFVEESGFAWQRGELCGESPVKGAKIRRGRMLPCPACCAVPPCPFRCWSCSIGLPVLLLAQHPDEVAVVTFNIRYDNPGDPVTWDQRKETVVGSVSYFDILGFQEALAHQQDFIAASLPEHDHYGVGRDDGQRAGEHCPVFWKRDRFDLLHAETLWLSETPHVAGSVGWDAELPRVATVVVLHDRRTEQVFRVINTHFSHIGEKARAKPRRRCSPAAFPEVGPRSTCCWGISIPSRHPVRMTF